QLIDAERPVELRDVRKTCRDTHASGSFDAEREFGVGQMFALRQLVQRGVHSLWFGAAVVSAAAADDEPGERREHSRRSHHSKIGAHESTQTVLRGGVSSTLSVVTRLESLPDTPPTWVTRKNLPGVTLDVEVC